MKKSVNRIIRTYRGRVNQGNTHQPYKVRNGTPCIVQDYGDGWVRIWFTEGPIHSMEVAKISVSEIKLSPAG